MSQDDPLQLRRPVDRLLEEAHDLYKQGRLDEAGQLYHAARVRRPERWEGHLGLAQVLFWKGDITAALTVAPDAIRADPTCLQAYQLLAAIGQSGGVGDRVIEWLEYGAQGMPQQAVIFEWLVRLYAQEGRREDLASCLRYYGQLRGLDPKEAALLFSRDPSLPEDVRSRIVSAAGPKRVT